VGRRLTLILLIGAVAAVAARYGPSWVDRRHDPHAALSARVVNFAGVRVNTQAEQLLTIRNGGHVSIAAKGTSGSLRAFNSVCPRRLGRVVRARSCGLSLWPAAECTALKPGAVCAVAIHFTPRTAKPYTARFCFRYAASDEQWRRTETCVTAAGRGERGGKGRSAR